jgi:hypothetical protein
MPERPAVPPSGPTTAPSGAVAASTDPRGRREVREFELAPADNERLANLCGPLDANLRLIEQRLGV